MVILYITTALLSILLIIIYLGFCSLYKRVKDLEESNHAALVRLRKIEEYLAPKENAAPVEPENKPVVEEKDDEKYSNPYDLARAIMDGKEVIK